MEFEIVYSCKSSHGTVVLVVEIEFLKILIKKQDKKQTRKKKKQHSTTNTVHMLSSTDDDDDASWSNLGTDLQGEEIVLEDVVGKKKTKAKFEEEDEKDLEEKPQMTCGKKDDSPPLEEEEKELEDIEDAWEGKDEEVRAWLELAEAQFDARTSPLIGAQQKQQTSHATTTKYETPTKGEGGEGPVQEKQPRREKRRRANAMKTLKRSLDVKLVMSSVVSICI